MADPLSQFMSDLLGVRVTPSDDSGQPAHGTKGTAYPSSMGRTLNTNLGENQLVSAGPKEVTSKLIVEPPASKQEAVPNKVPATAANTAGFDDTVRLQERLNSSGADLIVDGIDGPLTKAAMAQYMPTDDVNMPMITDEQMGVGEEMALRNRVMNKHKYWNTQGQDDPDYSGLSAMDLTGDEMNNEPQSRQSYLPETDTKTEPSLFKNPLDGVLDSYRDSQKATRELMENNKINRDAKRNNTINQKTNANSAMTSADIADLLSGNPSGTNPLASFDPDFLFDGSFTGNDVDIQPVPLETSDILRDEGPSTDFLTPDSPPVPLSADVQQIRLLQELIANGDTNSVQQILGSMPPDKAAAMIQQLAQ